MHWVAHWSEKSLFGLCMGLIATLAWPLHAQDTEPEAQPAGAPGWIQPFLDSEQLQVQFYEVRPTDQRYEGQTNFKFKIEYRIHYRTQTPRGPIRGTQKANLQFKQLQVKPEVLISLPRSYDHEGLWETALMRHELEHVRIDLDPRPVQLLQHAINSIRSVEIPAGSGQSSILKMADKAAHEKIDEITRLVQSNNDLLDRVTLHGTASENRDPNFFARLYMEPNLSEQEYPSLRLVKRLIGSRGYRDSVKPETSQP